MFSKHNASKYLAIFDKNSLHYGIGVVLEVSDLEVKCWITWMEAISFPASLNSLNLHTKSRYQKSKFHYCFFPIICCFVAWKTFLIIVLVCQVPQLGCQDNSDPLSSAELSLCCKEAGVKEKESARGTIPTIPCALAIFKLLLFLLGYPVGFSAVKRDSDLKNSHLTPLKTSDPLCASGFGKNPEYRNHTLN